MAAGDIEEKKKELGKVLSSLLDTRFTINRVFEVIRGEASPHLVVPSKLQFPELQEQIKNLTKDVGYQRVLDPSCSLSSKECQKELKELEKLAKKYSK